MVQQWLAAAQLAQVGMDRLVGTLELIAGGHRVTAARHQVQECRYCVTQPPSVAATIVSHGNR